MQVTIGNATVYIGDALEVLKSMEGESVQCCVTSPPYFGLRDYGVDNQLGLERIPEEYIAKLIEVFREVSRVLRKNGTCWLNLGDSYNSSPSNQQNGAVDGPAKELAFRAQGRKKRNIPNLKPKDLCGIPWRTALALQADGWWLRSDIIWHKPNCLPESVTDRPTKAHEYIFLLSKNQRYYYDAEAIREESITKDTRSPYTSLGAWELDGRPAEKRNSGKPKKSSPDLRNKRSVWTINTYSYKGAHFATYPPALIEPCILAGSKPGDTILDPFFGSGTTGEVALKYDRKIIGIELNPEYRKLWEKRVKRAQRQLRLCGTH